MIKLTKKIIKGFGGKQTARYDKTKQWITNGHWAVWAGVTECEYQIEESTCDVMAAVGEEPRNSTGEVKEVKLLGLYTEDMALFSCGAELCFIATTYLQLIEKCDKLEAASALKPIFCYLGDSLMAIIMPARDPLPESKFYDSVRFINSWSKEKLS